MDLEVFGKCPDEVLRKPITRALRTSRRIAALPWLPWRQLFWDCIFSWCRSWWLANTRGAREVSRLTHHRHRFLLCQALHGLHPTPCQRRRPEDTCGRRPEPSLVSHL